MVLKNHDLSGEERKIVSTRLYKSEFLFFKKLCDREGKTVNTKLREMINWEIKKDPTLFSKTLLEKKREDLEKGEENLKQRFKIEIKEGKKNVQPRKN